MKLEIVKTNWRGFNWYNDNYKFLKFQTADYANEVDKRMWTFWVEHVTCWHWQSCKLQMKNLRNHGQKQTMHKMQSCFWVMVLIILAAKNHKWYLVRKLSNNLIIAIWNYIAISLKLFPDRKFIAQKSRKFIELEDL